MISTHILDTSKGMPASGIKVQLLRKKGKTWEIVNKGISNSDGRIVFDCSKKPGTYQLQFSVKKYFKNQDTFFEEIPILFVIKDTKRKYHVPLLLNPFGYATYRGS